MMQLEDGTLLYLQSETNSLIQSTCKYQVVNEWDSGPSDSSLDHLKTTNHYGAERRFLWFMGSMNAGIFNTKKLKNTEIKNIFGANFDFSRCPMAVIYNKKDKWLLGLSCNTQSNDSSLHILRKGQDPVHENIFLVCAFTWCTTMDMLPEMDHIVIAGSDKREKAKKSYVQVIKVDDKTIQSTVKFELTKKLSKQEVTCLRVIDDHKRFLLGSKGVVLVMQVSIKNDKIKLIDCIKMKHEGIHDIWFKNFEMVTVGIEDEHISKVQFEGWAKK